MRCHRVPCGQIYSITRVENLVPSVKHQSRVDLNDGVSSSSYSFGFGGPFDGCYHEDVRPVGMKSAHEQAHVEDRVQVTTICAMQQNISPLGTLWTQDRKRLLHHHVPQEVPGLSTSCSDPVVRQTVGAWRTYNFKSLLGTGRPLCPFHQGLDTVRGLSHHHHRFRSGQVPKTNCVVWGDGHSVAVSSVHVP